MNLSTSAKSHRDAPPRSKPGQSAEPAGRFIFVGKSLSLDLVNTEKMVEGRRTDLLQTPDDLKAWLREAALVTAENDLWSGDVDGKKALNDIKAFRKVLRGMAGDMAAGAPMREETVSAINAALKRKASVLQLRQVDGVWKVGHEVSGRHSLDHIIAEIAESAADLISGHDWGLVRQCASDRCILFFLDTTKNHARRWCSMGVCGNRVKANAHYRRSRA